MILEELIKPVLVIASDGWIEAAYKPGDLTTWTVGATKKYTMIGLLVFSADDRVWALDEFIIREQPTFIESIRSWMTFLPPIAVVDLKLREQEGDALTSLVTALRCALDKDCDVVTQFSPKEDILKSVEGAVGIRDVIKRLKMLKAIQ